MLRGIMVATAVAGFLGADAVAMAQTTYGGGRLASIERSRTYRPTVGFVLQTRGSTQAAIRFTTTVLCGKTSYDVSARKLVTLTGSRFSAKGASTIELDGAVLGYAWRINGGVNGQAADGVLRIAGALKTAKRTRKCAQRPVRAFQARARYAPTGAFSGPERAGAYVGLSDSTIVDGLPGPVRLRVSPDGLRVGAMWEASAPCEPRSREVFTNFTPSSAIRRDGSFYRAERFTVRYSDAVVRYRVRFSGRFRVDGAVGTLQQRATIYDRRGKRVRARCDSGRRSWTAMRASLVPAAPYTLPSR